MRYHVRTAPDGIRRIVTRTAMIEIECLWAEHNIVQTTTLAFVGNSQAEIDAARAETIAELQAEARARVLERYEP